ncbi:unnamed protein product, partial [Thlaspi arvense]
SRLLPEFFSHVYRKERAKLGEVTKSPSPGHAHSPRDAYHLTVCQHELAVFLEGTLMKNFNGEKGREKEVRERNLTSTTLSSREWGIIGGKIYSPSSQTPLTPPPLLSSTDSKPYVVFRNEIPLSSIRWPSLETAAPEYFSLDTTADTEEPTSPVLTPLPAATPPPVPEPRRTLEGVWFRPNFWFKSPMLQLHKVSVPAERFILVTVVWCGYFMAYKTPQLGLHALAEALSQRGIAKKMQVIAKARVPIVKFIEKKSGVAFDISGLATSVVEVCGVC